MTLTACGGNGNNESSGTKFAPTEKQSSLSESERSAAIAEKKASLAFSVDSILNYNGKSINRTRARSHCRCGGAHPG